MTEKLFYQDSHMKEFDAEVLSCEVFQDKNGRELYRVVLDRTAFFPEGGGQTDLSYDGFSAAAGENGAWQNRLERALFKDAAAYWGAHPVRTCA